MISICIPVYNSDVGKLVEELILQIDSSVAEAEIIIIDDASQELFRNVNSGIQKSVKYIQLEKNIGRSQIRNLFTEYASYNYLLFLDCDSLIISKSFLKRYMHVIKEKSPEIVCGGRKYCDNRPENERMLRWTYGHKRESKSAKQRNEKPNDSFMTNNFLIQKEILKNFPFEESLSEYGHEDTLFGYLLKKNKISIQHIENPILSGDLEENQEFLIKTESGIKNLVKILHLLNNDPEFIRSVMILRWYKRLSEWRLINLFNGLFFITKSSLRKLSFRKKGSLYAFNLYKLGYLCYLLSTSEDRLI
jgi:glycosyltransferase involved in cell wall biosynthesis